MDCIWAWFTHIDIIAREGVVYCVSKFAWWPIINIPYPLPSPPTGHLFMYTPNQLDTCLGMFMHLHYPKLVGYHPPSKGIYNSVLDLFFCVFEVKMLEIVQNYVL